MAGGRRRGEQVLCHAAVPLLLGCRVKRLEGNGLGSCSRRPDHTAGAEVSGADDMCQPGPGFQLPDGHASTTWDFGRVAKSLEDGVQICRAPGSAGVALEGRRKRAAAVQERLHDGLREFCYRRPLRARLHSVVGGKGDTAGYGLGEARRGKRQTAVAPRL